MLKSTMMKLRAEKPFSSCAFIAILSHDWKPLTDWPRSIFLVSITSGTSAFKMISASCFLEFYRWCPGNISHCWVVGEAAITMSSNSWVPFAGSPTPADRTGLTFASSVGTCAKDVIELLPLRSNLWLRPTLYFWGYANNLEWNCRKYAISRLQPCFILRLDLLTEVVNRVARALSAAESML